MRHSSRLAALIAELDGLGPDLSLAAIARSLSSFGLTSGDVTAHVQPNPRHYHRGLVVRRPQYELLVMTWLPGQASVPHDHTGSVCAMQVVTGKAVEADYSIAADGCVELEFETTIRAGQVSAGQDAGVHTIRNPSATETLVTVHVYAPPLAEFRRFVPRTAVHAADSTAPDTVAVIGGGFSGTMVAANLLRHSPATNVVLMERRGTVGEGLAYGTRDDVHLLNVPAARMSAWPDQPEHFLEWARRRDTAVQPGDFLPRMHYGEYLREVLHTAAAEPGRLDIRLDEARRVTRHPAGGWMVHLGRGASLRARAVVLAIGHRPPNDPLRDLWQGPRDRLLADPWRPFSLNVVEPHHSVAILGSGLTAVDTVLSLTREPRTGPITMISRSGLMPHPHSRTPLKPFDAAALIEELQSDPRARRMARALHRAARATVNSGGDWRPVIDALRPRTADLWQRLPDTEKLRFLARLRPFWEVHRHRMAPHIADRIADLFARGVLHRVAAAVRRALGATDRVVLDLQNRGSAGPRPHSFDWVVNCTGPAPSNSAEGNPVVGSLLVHGWLTRDPLSLGLQSDSTGRAVGSAGQAVSDLFIVGTLRKPLLWESTAVPELRSQAAVVAKACAVPCADHRSSGDPHPMI